MQLLVAVMLVGTAQAADDLPQKLNFDRYSAMLERSPFAVATAVAPAPTTPNWSKDLYVANAARTSDADYVTIISGGDKNLKEYLSTKEPNDHGYAIANIQWSDKPGETKVTISKDGQFATLPFNQALLTPNMPATVQGAGAVPGGPVMPPAGVPTPPQPVVSRPAVPQAVTPVPAQTPRTRGVIQRNPAAQAPPPVATPFIPQPVDE